MRVAIVLALASPGCRSLELDAAPRAGISFLASCRDVTVSTGRHEPTVQFSAESYAVR